LNLKSCPNTCLFVGNFSPLSYSLRVSKGVNNLKYLIKKVGAAVGTFGIVAAAAAAGSIAAPPPFSLQPFEFVGTVENCGVAGVDTVTAEWDNSTGNPSPSILLQKLGATANCASAGVDIITPLEGGSVSAITELNFDYEDGGHCGAGAPRFNIQSGNKVAFLGCAGGTHTDLGNGWIHVEFTPAQIAAALTTATILPTDTLDDLYIIFDEGEDTPSGGTIGTSGTVHIDNISLNSDEVGSPTSPQSKEDCKKGGWQNLTDAEGNPFKNQGDCVSYFATGGKNKGNG
jgi:hypothetical protein